jgi:hypothetical protein
MRTARLSGLNDNNPLRHYIRKHFPVYRYPEEGRSDGQLWRVERQRI